MARNKRTGRGPGKKRVALATGLALVLLAALIAGMAAVLGELRLQRQAAAAGISRFSRDIPRNPYAAEHFSMENGRAAYEDESCRTETGIDVSVHQCVIDWQAVAGDGIDFAVIQAGYRGYSDGDLGEDEQFRANLEGARAAGIPTGVYFFSQAVNEAEARDEAEFVLSLLDGTALDLPVFYDWERIESDTARTEQVDGDTVTACAAAFCETIEAGGYDAGVYFNQNYVYTFVDRSKLLNWPLWLAQYQSAPDFFYDFSYWQYTDSGSVAGISAPVDLSLRFLPKDNSDDS